MGRSQREGIRVTRMRKLLVTMGGLFLVIGSLALSTAVTSGTALAQSHQASATCAYPQQCVGISSSSGSVPPGGTITLSGHGYAPGSTVTINVCGIETITVTADSSGDFTTTITIPSGTPAQSCTITASGTGSNGQTVTSSTTVTITSGTTVPPPATGEPWAAVLYWVLAGAAGLAGFMMFEIGRRRRKIRTTP